MSWKIPSNFFQRLNVKLILIVTLTATTASLIAYGFLLGSLAADFDAKNKAELDSRLFFYVAIWDYGGINVMLKHVSDDMKRHGGSPFLFMLKNSKGETIDGLIPGGWDSFDLENPMLTMLHPGTYLTLKNKKMNYSLLLTGTRFRDDMYVIIGMSTENRDVLLRMYKNSYPLALGGIIIAAMLVGFIATRRLLSPIKKLNLEINHTIITGDMNRRLENYGTNDHLDELISHYNGLLDRVESLINGMRETLDTVAHELRTPLTRLRGFAELALSKKAQSEYEEALAMVVEQTDQANALLSTLMDIAEAEQGMLTLNKETCDLRKISEEIIEIYTFIAEEKDQHITLESPAPVHLNGDVVRIRQILGNILDNAVKYSAKGGVIAVQCFTEKDLYIIEVRDDGPGISEHEFSQVFERCYRGTQSHASRGLGLGLSMVKALTEAHGGSVSVRNGEKCGAIFRVELPNIS